MSECGTGNHAGYGDRASEDDTVFVEGQLGVSEHDIKTDKLKASLNLGRELKWLLALILATTFKMTIRLIRAPFALGFSLAALLVLPFAILLNVGISRLPYSRFLRPDYVNAMVQFLMNRILGLNDPPGGTQAILLSMLKKHATELALTVTLAGLVAATLFTAGTFVPAAASALTPVLGFFGISALPTVGLSLGTLSAVAGVGAAAGVVAGLAVVSGTIWEGLYNRKEMAKLTAYENITQENAPSFIQHQTKRAYGNTIGTLRQDFNSLSPAFHRPQIASRANPFVVDPEGFTNDYRADVYDGKPPQFKKYGLG